MVRRRSSGVSGIQGSSVVANRLKRCKNKECGKYFEPPKESPDIRHCSPECATAILEKHWAKQRLQQERARKRSQKAEKAKDKKRLGELQPMSHWLKLTQGVFNEYIRLRDIAEPCISCGTNSDVQYCAGHFRTRGAAGHLRFDENNTNKQCNKRCNLEMSGNIAGYRPRLVEKIGLEAVESLENDNTLKSWTREELADLRRKYRAKIKDLESIGG